MFVCPFKALLDGALWYAFGTHDAPRRSSAGANSYNVVDVLVTASRRRRAMQPFVIETPSVQRYQ